MVSKRVKFSSELRYDIISRDWVLIAAGRAGRPEAFKEKKRKEEELPQKECPFCNIGSQVKPTLVFSNGKKIPTPRRPSGEWTTIVIPNKFPAVMPGQKLDERTEGKLFKRMKAIGFHEVVITKHHKKHLAQFSREQLKEVIDVYQERYLSLAKEKLVNYISIFHNQGVQAGASISHPHSQILTTPLIDVDLRRALANSEAYFKEKGSCIYCLMADWERRTKKRIVFENESFLALCPFASKVAFQLIISPKKHLSYFERASEQEKQDLAEAFRVVLNKLYKGLGDPAYNFYLHTAPCDGKKYPFYHWHWTILPKTATPAGFEIGTHMEISTIEPEKAAEYLRKQ